MSVSNGQVANATTWNNAFVSRTQNTTLAGTLTQSNTTQSTTKDTGAIVTEGGLGVEKNINAGGNIAAGGTISATGNISGANFSGTNTGDLALAAVGSVPNANGASLSGQTLTLQPASDTQPGLMTAIAQTFAGVKTWAANLILQAALLLNKADVATAATITSLSSTTSYVKFTGSTVTSVRGIVAGGNGQILILNNASSAVVTLLDESGSAASASERINTHDGNDLAIAAGASVKLVYDTSAARWLVIGGTATAGGSVFTGDSGAGGVQGLVPAPTAGDAAAEKFLHADGTWTTPAGVGAPVVAIYQRNTGYTMPNNSDTIIDFDDLIVDTHSAVTTGASWKFEVPAGKGGQYYVSASFGFEDNANGIRYSYFTVNGTPQPLADTCKGSGSSGSLWMNPGGLLDLADGDEVSLLGYQNSGGNLDTNTTFLSKIQISIHQILGTS